MTHNYELPADAVRLALLFGVVMSLVVYERARVTAGASMVAGYLAIFVGRPLYIATTLGLAVATYALVQRVIAQRFFLYGRRRLMVMVLAGLVLQLAAGGLAMALHQPLPWLLGLSGIGFVLPGLIAQDL